MTKIQNLFLLLNIGIWDFAILHYSLAPYITPRVTPSYYLAWALELSRAPVIAQE